jgi:ribonuclease Z
LSALLQPRLINGPFEDPALYLGFRFSRRAILFDLGDLARLSSREILRVTHAFVSHTHMDHFAGFDRLLRPWLHRTGTLALVGPVGFIEQVEHRLRSYSWNLLDANSIDFRLLVSEFDGDRVASAAEFRAREGFSRRALPPTELAPGLVLSEPDFAVEAVALDHGITSLGFALRQNIRVNVWRTALDEMGYPVGPWLNEAKRAMRRGMPDDHLVEVPGHGAVALGRMRERAFRLSRGQSLAYVTDAADHAANRARIVRLAAGADHLFIETAFLHRDRALAEATGHLTAQAAGEIARAAEVGRVTPFHFSGRYLADPEVLATELYDAFGRERNRMAGLPRDARVGDDSQ